MCGDVGTEDEQAKRSINEMFGDDDSDSDSDDQIRPGEWICW